MNNIYKYSDEFDKTHIISEINDIEEEKFLLSQDDKKSDKDLRNEEFKLIYKQFIKGLKLSII